MSSEIKSESNDSPCEKFELHPRRKLCEVCKYPQYEHPLSEDDTAQIHRLLTSLAKDCGADGPKSDSKYAWIPPQCPENRLDEYFGHFLDDEVPRHNSEGFQWRMKMLMKQIPTTDVTVSKCRFIEPDFFPNLEEFTKNIRSDALSFGVVKPWSKGMPAQCPECLKLLKEQELVVVPTASHSALAFHPTCFRCCECRQHLVDMACCSDVKGSVYCVRHYSESRMKRCHACDELIFTERYTQAGSKYYHTDHLRCFHCDHPLEENIGFDKDGELYCKTCFGEKFGDVCEKCNERIPMEAKHIAFEGKFWHYRCFKCEKCEEVMTEFKYDGAKFYCEKCFDEHVAIKCGSCKNINDEKQEFLKYNVVNKKMITCHKCQVQLVDKTFQTVNDYIYCTHCYVEAFYAKCHSCRQAIWLDSNEVTYSLGDIKWHLDCFICGTCGSHLAGKKFAIRENELVCEQCQRARLSTVTTSKDLSGELWELPGCGSQRVRLSTVTTSKDLSGDLWEPPGCGSHLAGKKFAIRENGLVCGKCQRARVSTVSPFVYSKDLRKRKSLAASTSGDLKDGKSTESIPKSSEAEKSDSKNQDKKEKESDSKNQDKKEKESDSKNQDKKEKESYSKNQDKKEKESDSKNQDKKEKESDSKNQDKKEKESDSKKQDKQAKERDDENKEKKK